jgi:hypothetical protein
MVALDPTYPMAPTMICIAAPSPPELPNVKRGCCYMPTSHSKLAESETWMLRLGYPGKDQLDLLPGNVTSVPPVF